MGILGTVMAGCVIVSCPVLGLIVHSPEVPSTAWQPVWDCATPLSNLVLVSAVGNVDWVELDSELSNSILPAGELWKKATEPTFGIQSPHPYWHRFDWSLYV